jgi:hypothetical protein
MLEKKVKFLACYGILLQHNYVTLVNVTLHILCEHELLFSLVTTLFNILVILASLLTLIVCPVNLWLGTSHSIRTDLITLTTPGQGVRLTTNYPI